MNFIKLELNLIFEKYKSYESSKQNRAFLMAELTKYLKNIILDSFEIADLTNPSDSSLGVIKYIIQCEGVDYSLNDFLDSKVSNLKALEYNLSKYPLTFHDSKSDYVENYNFEPNYFVTSFYKFIDLKGRIPSQSEFAKYYIDSNLDFLKKGFLETTLDSKKLLTNLVYRLFRSYPSFIRDYHFYLYLKEYSEMSVYYDVNLDVFKGIDLLLDSKYAIHLFIDTPRANEYRLKKTSRHFEDSYEHLNISASFKSNQIGDFFLYGEKEYFEILRGITYLKSKQNIY